MMSSSHLVAIAALAATVGSADAFSQPHGPFSCPCCDLLEKKPYTLLEAGCTSG